MNGSTVAEEGFSLLEVIIAFGVISIALATFYWSVSSGIGDLASSKSMDRAVTGARSILDETIARQAVPDAVRGTFADGTTWRMTGTEIRPQSGEVGRQSSGASWITVEVFDRNERVIVRLKSVALISAKRQ